MIIPKSELGRNHRISVPAHAHPHAKLIFELMRECGATYDVVEHYSGVLRSSVKSWRGEKIPSLQSLEAVLGALGWGIAPYPALESLPPHVREMAEELGQHFFSDEHALAAAVAAAIAQPGARGSADQRAPRLTYRAPYWRETAKAA